MLYWADAQLTAADLQSDATIYAAAVLLGVGGIHAAAAHAMLADLIEPAQRAAIFPCLHGAMQAGPIVAYGLGFLLLRWHLLDYRGAWLVQAVAGAGVVTLSVGLLRETLPARRAGPRLVGVPGGRCGWAAAWTPSFGR